MQLLRIDCITISMRYVMIKEKSIGASIDESPILYKSFRTGESIGSVSEVTISANLPPIPGNQDKIALIVSNIIDADKRRYRTVAKRRKSISKTILPYKNPTGRLSPR